MTREDLVVMVSPYQVHTELLIEPGNGKTIVGLGLVEIKGTGLSILYEGISSQEHSDAVFPVLYNEIYKQFSNWKKHNK